MDLSLNNSLKELFRKCYLLLAVLFLFHPLSYCQYRAGSDTAFFNNVDSWFKAWELVSKDIYRINKTDRVDFVFFDETHIYSSSTLTAAGGESIAGPSLMGRKILWLKKNYKDSILLPDGRKVEAGLMSFASANKNSRPYFVMPLVSFWKMAGVTSKEMSIEMLVTGIFLHEFSHSQQVKNFGEEMNAIEKKYHFPTAFSDDIVQHVFGKDEAYAKRFHEETGLFYLAAAEKSEERIKSILKEALNGQQSRQSFYFTDSLSHYKQIDDLFLTMEGVGQYSMYAWLVHPKGGNLPKELAITGVRRGKKQWSQEEGLAIFLVLEKLIAPRQWGAYMFGKKLRTANWLFDNYLKQTN